MKKFFYLAISTCMALFTACSNDDSPRDVTDGKVIFDLGVTNELSDGFASKALLSATPVNNVSDVNIYVFKEQTAGSGTYAWIETLNVSQWSVGLTSYSYSVTDNTPFVGGGKFKFIAVGRTTPTTNYTIAAPTTSTLFDNFLATGITYPRQNDIFAGSTGIVDVAEGGTARVSIEMTRKVAGVLGYFSNVPVSVDVNGTPTTVGSLGVVVKQVGNTSVNLVTGAGSVPGILSNFGVVGLIDLTAQQNDGFFYAGNNPAGVSVLENTQLGGSFVVPMTAASMEVRLYGTDNSTVLKTWQVVDENNSTTFDLVANHLYSLGIKNSTTSTDGDVPINLSQNEVITVTLSPVWNTIHDMNIQE